MADKGDHPSFVFERGPRFAARHPWYVLAATALVFLAVFMVWRSEKGRYTDNFTLPGSESQAALDLLRSRFPAAAGDPATVVVRAPGGLQQPAAQTRLNALVAELKTLPEVVDVTPPSTQGGSISQDGTIARINVQYDKKARDVQKSSAEALANLQKRSSGPGFQVEVGGPVINVVERPGIASAEVIGVLAAVFILLLAFGSVVAMGLPIITALLAVGMGLLIVGIGTQFVNLASFTPQFAGMIGLGVGIDYALLVVTRFREGLARGDSVEDSVVMASATAGRSVLFAGSTVVIALLGLWAIGLTTIADVGTSAAIVVAIAVVVALVVQPAVLGLVGRRIDSWRLPFLTVSMHPDSHGFGYRLSRAIQKAPLPALLFSLGVLVLLALPLTRIHLGSSDAGNNPTSYTSRRAYDLLSRGFGPGFNGPVTVAIEVNSPSGLTTVDRLSNELKSLQGVARVSQPRLNADRSAATLTVIPTTSPESTQTSDLVHRLRTAVRQDTAGTPVVAHVGGQTAAFIDMTDKVTSRMPIFFAAVIGVSFIVLMAAFRSLLVPLKAAVMNLLSIGAAYGVLVAVFQWGWLGSIIGLTRTGPIESFLPMFLFAVLFGLSMDYEVFLVSRIREEYILTGNASNSVARGLSLTSRVITAAAAIMVAVFVSFAFGDQRVIKEFGIGLATAIFVDATLVRLILVPAFMQLMGEANWWFPRWLDRLVPQISFEPSRLITLHRRPLAVPADGED